MLGPGVLAFVFGTADIITGSTIANAFLAAFFAFVVTWLVAFLVRRFSLPAEYYSTEKERADRLESIDARQQAKTHLWALREEVFHYVPKVGGSKKLKCRTGPKHLKIGAGLSFKMRLPIRPTYDIPSILWIKSSRIMWRL